MKGLENMRRIEDDRGIVHEFEQTIIGSDGAVHCRMQRKLDGASLGDVVHYLSPDEAAPAFASDEGFFAALAAALVAAGKCSGEYKGD